MKKTGVVLFVGAGLLIVWAIVLIILNSVSYASYIPYYGLSAVLPSILDGVMQLIALGLILFGMGSFCVKFDKYFAKNDQPCASKALKQAAYNEFDEDSKATTEE